MKTKVNLDVPVLAFAAKKLSVISHPVRMQIIEMLDEFTTLSMGQIQQKLNLRQPDTSLHLTGMRKYGILTKVREGKKSLYSLNREAIEEIKKVSETLSKR